MTRSTKKKQGKKVKKTDQKLRYEYIKLKKEYEEKVANLHIQLLDQRYYINSILDFVRRVSRDPWDQAVYGGFRSMCTFDD